MTTPQIPRSLKRRGGREYSTPNSTDPAAIALGRTPLTRCHDQGRSQREGCDRGGQALSPARARFPRIRARDPVLVEVGDVVGGVSAHQQGRDPGDVKDQAGRRSPGPPGVVPEEDGAGSDVERFIPKVPKADEAGSIAEKARDPLWFRGHDSRRQLLRQNRSLSPPLRYTEVQRRSRSRSIVSGIRPGPDGHAEKIRMPGIAISPADGVRDVSERIADPPSADEPRDEPGLLQRGVLPFSPIPVGGEGDHGRIDLRPHGAQTRPDVVVPQGASQPVEKILMAEPEAVVDAAVPADELRQLAHEERLAFDVSAHLRHAPEADLEDVLHAPGQRDDGTDLVLVDAPRDGRREMGRDVLPVEVLQGLELDIQERPPVRPAIDLVVQAVDGQDDRAQARLAETPDVFRVGEADAVRHEDRRVPLVDGPDELRQVLPAGGLRPAEQDAGATEGREHPPQVVQGRLLESLLPLVTDGALQVAARGDIEEMVHDDVFARHHGVGVPLVESGVGLDEDPLDLPRAQVLLQEDAAVLLEDAGGAGAPGFRDRGPWSPE